MIEDEPKNGKLEERERWAWGVGRGRLSEDRPAAVPRITTCSLTLGFLPDFPSA